MQEGGSEEIIINNKHISTAKNLFSRRNLIISLSVPLLFLSAPKAEAAGSPVRSLIEFSKEKIKEVREIEIENPILVEQVKINQEREKVRQEQINASEEKKQRKEKNKKLGIPEAVSDPKEMERAVEFAAKETGVRKNFIMGLLTVESNLGRNPGECTYQQVEEGAKESYQNGRLSERAWNTFNQRRETIKDIAKSLGYDYEKLNVSCNPGAAYAGTGGAMGIPQFMPDTWLEYKDRIAAIVGKDNPDPWDKEDAAVAVALKLSDVYGVTDHNRFAEKNAAKLYLSGTTSYQYDWYANKILYWAENYQYLIG